MSDAQASLVSAVATAIGAVVSALLSICISLWKSVPSLSRPRVSRLIAQFTEVESLESHLAKNEVQQEIVEFRKKCIADETLEYFAYQTYMWRGLRSEELDAKSYGYAACSFIGALCGIALSSLLSLVFYVRKDREGIAWNEQDSLATFWLFFAFLVLLFLSLLIKAVDKRVYKRMTLKQRFKIDVLSRFRNGRYRPSLLSMSEMAQSLKRLVQYEEKRSKYRLEFIIACGAITFSLSAIVFNAFFKWPTWIIDKALWIYFLAVLALPLLTWIAPKLTDGLRVREKFCLVERMKRFFPLRQGDKEQNGNAKLSGIKGRGCGCCKCCRCCEWPNQLDRDDVEAQSK